VAGRGEVAGDDFGDAKILLLPEPERSELGRELTRIEIGDPRLAGGKALARPN